MRKIRRILPILFAVLTISSILMFVALRFYNPFRKYPSDTTLSAKPLLSEVRIPQSPGIKTFSNNGVTIDYSNSNLGYITISTNITDQTMKFQVIFGDITYTYDLFANELLVVPLQSGTGTYTVRALRNVGGNSYASITSTKIDAAPEDDLSNYLYPNQIVNYTIESLAVKKSFELVKDADTELRRVYIIYNYIIRNIKYDSEKAKKADTTFMIPVVDETLTTQKGICFDYAALMAAMLRVQQIPTKVVTGYVDIGYHSWVEVYIKDVGWINPRLYFEKLKWKLVDPTFDASGGFYLGSYQNKYFY